MDRDAIIEKVYNLVAEELSLDVDTLSMETEFKALGADSFDLLELVTAFEDEFGATLEDERLMAIVTVADAVDAIEKAL